MAALEVMPADNFLDPGHLVQNQKALMTGANSGIGEACAIALGGDLSRQDHLRRWRHNALPWLRDQRLTENFL